MKKKDKNNKKELIDLYKINRENKTEDDFSNNDDDWEDDKNDSFDYKTGFNENKEKDKNDKQEDKYTKPVDISKIGQVEVGEKKKCEIAYLGSGFSDDIQLI